MSEPRAVLCSRCRRLVSASEKVCPWCGARRPALFGFAPGLQALFRDGPDPVWALVSASVALYMLSLLLDPQAALQPRGLFDLASPSGMALLKLGMTGGQIMAAGLWWTPLSAVLLHGSLLHIFFNLSWIRQLGPMAVELFGPARFLVIYLLGGALGFVFSNLVSGAPTIGASCSIFALYGALFAYGKRRGGTWGARVSQQAYAWAAGGLVISMAMPNVNNWGHLGGLLAGLGLGWVLPSAERRQESRASQLLAIALVLASAGAVLASLWMTRGMSAQ